MLVIFEMGDLDLGHVKKQASLFLREKMRTARLLLTDVTNAQLLAEEATNNDPWGPESRTMNAISQAAFEVDEYWRIMDLLNNRLSVVNKKHRIECFKTLVLLEYLLTHGPESVATDFRNEIDVIQKLAHFKCVDDTGVDWGLKVRNKMERILQLLNDKKLLKEERNHCRNVSRQIRLGSFSSTTSSSISFLSSTSTTSIGRAHSALDLTERYRTTLCGKENGNTVTSHNNCGYDSVVPSKFFSNEDRYFVDENNCDSFTSSLDKSCNLQSEKCNFDYDSESNHDCKPVNGSSIANSDSPRIDIQKKSDKRKPINGYDGNIGPMEKSISESFCEWIPRTENQYLLNSMTGESYNNLSEEAAYSKDVHDFDKESRIESLVLNKSKRIFVDISDFHNLGGLITQKCTKCKAE